MKLHESVVTQLIHINTNFGGHSTETRLKAMVEQFRLAPLFDETTSIMTFVSAEKLLQYKAARRQATNDVTPMRLHPLVVDKLMKTFDLHSGHSNESKLRAALSKIDLTPYERKTTGEVLTVLTEDFMKIMQNPSGAEK